MPPPDQAATGQAVASTEMAKELERTDISHLPELARPIEEARRNDMPAPRAPTAPPPAPPRADTAAAASAAPTARTPARPPPAPPPAAAAAHHASPPLP